jgi:cytochrome c556
MTVHHALVLGVVLVTAGSALAQSQFRKPEDAVRYRKSVMAVMQEHLGSVGAMVSGRQPFNAKAVADHAQVLAVLAPLQFAGFTKETENLSNKVKPELWMAWDKAKSAADKMNTETQNLLAASKTGNIDAIKKTFGDVAGSCKSCHDAYRE